MAMTTAVTQVGWPQKTNTSAAIATARYPERPAVGVGPPADRAGAHAGVLAAPAKPVKSGFERAAGADRGDRGPGEERGDRDDQPDHQQHPQPVPDEPDQRVVQDRGRVGGQHAGRHAVEVDAAEDRQPQAQDHHGRG